MQDWLKTHGGRGAGQRLAAAMQVHPSLVSQVARGNRILTPDQAEAAAHFLSLVKLETEFFVGLVERELAATPLLRKRLEERLLEVRHRAHEVRAQLSENRELDEREQARFYSSGAYSAVRLATSLPQGKTVQGIAQLLDLPRMRVAEILEFLEGKGLIERDERGRLKLGAARVHVPSTSPFVVNHHRNWRARSSLHLEALTDEELAFTSPMTLATKDLPKVKAILLAAVAQIREVVQGSEPEELVAVTIDLWREFASPEK